MEMAPKFQYNSATACVQFLVEQQEGNTPALIVNDASHQHPAAGSRAVKHLLLRFWIPGGFGFRKIPL